MQKTKQMIVSMRKRTTLSMTIATKSECKKSQGKKPSHSNICSLEQFNSFGECFPDSIERLWANLFFFSSQDTFLLYLMKRLIARWLVGIWFWWKWNYPVIFYTLILFWRCRNIIWYEFAIYCLAVFVFNPWISDMRKLMLFVGVRFFLTFQQAFNPLKA